jgi:hypothetical protein
MEQKNISEAGKSANEEKQGFEKKEHVKEAFEQAQDDLAKDPEFQPHEDEDLDEGELARKEGHP